MTVAAPSRWGGEPAGWTPTQLQHRRRALHTLALSQRLVVQRPREPGFASWSVGCALRTSARGLPAGSERWQCHHRTARACDLPPFISSPSRPSRLQHRHAAFSGAGQPQFQLPHRHGFEVSICGDAWSKQHRLTPQPREGPVLSADHVFFRHRLFDFR